MAEIDRNKEVKVTNRIHGKVGYQLQDGTVLINRQFTPGQSLFITFDELEKLSWAPGGRALIEDDLIIHDEEIAKQLLGNIEPEYLYTDEDLIRIMTKGTLDEFLDLLDFAPEGTLNNIKDLAVSLPLNDVSKREAISEKLGFNVTASINLRKEAEVEKKETEKPTRRVVAKTTEEAQPARRVIIKK